MSKIHYVSIPCGAHKLWPSTVLTSNPDATRTTCENCRRSNLWRMAALAEERKLLTQLRKSGRFRTLEKPLSEAELTSALQKLWDETQPTE
jgi:hypothetical protein